MTQAHVLTPRGVALASATRIERPHCPGLMRVGVAMAAVATAMVQAIRVTGGMAGAPIPSTGSTATRHSLRPENLAQNRVPYGNRA